MTQDLNFALKMTQIAIGSQGASPEKVLKIFSYFLSCDQNFVQDLNVFPLKRPAVPIEESVTDDYIICLEDGKKLQMLKRHLKTVYNMSLADYKTRWNLPPTYPTTCKNYSKHRSNLAKQFGLGLDVRKPKK